MFFALQLREKRARCCVPLAPARRAVCLSRQNGGKKTVAPSNCSYARYDIDQTETRDLFVGCARNLEVYAYQNSELVHLGNIYNEPFANPNAPGIYTYGGFGTGAGGSVFFAINEKNELQIAPDEVHMSYLVSDLQSTYLVNDHAVSEEEYNASVDLHLTIKRAFRCAPFRKRDAPPDMRPAGLKALAACLPQR